MRFTTVLLTVVISNAFITAGCQTTQRTSGSGHAYAADTEAIETPTVTLTVHGMGCPLCANNVDQQLLALAGVREVNVNLDNGEVKVHLDEANRPSRAQLAHAVHRSGFTLVRIETP